MRLVFRGAARTVTGSRYLLSTERATVLVDAGMFQEHDKLGLNWEDPAIDAKKIDAVLITHGHLDHCGWLPKLVRDGFGGPVWCTPATADLIPIVIDDAARIQEEDAKFKAKRHEREGRLDSRPPQPLYTGEDAKKAARLLRSVPLGQTQEVAPGVEAVWHENGHIPGAGWICLRAEGKTLVFSGDIGRWERPILNDPDPPSEADYLFIESTYGNRTHVTGDTAGELRGVLAQAHARGGNLLIPSFSVERAQELLYTLAELVKQDQVPFGKIFLDSPMAARVTKLFNRHPEVCDPDMLALMRSGQNPFAFRGLKFTTSQDESKKINDVTSGAIIIAGNGMCTGGRIKHHLMRHIGDSRHTLLFVGYQAKGTLGRQIFDGAKEVRLFNMNMPVRCNVAMLRGLSGHADSGELQRWAGSIRTPPKTCFVTHGDPDAAQALAAALATRPGWTTTVPDIGDEVEL